MPLVKSASKAALRRNIGELIASGRKAEQAAAIAHAVRRKALENQHSAQRAQSNK